MKFPTCIGPECNRRVHVQSRRLCFAHYYQFMERGKDMSKLTPLESSREVICKYEGCEYPAIARGWCQSHYYQYMTRGRDVSKMKPVRPQGGNPPAQALEMSA